MQKGIFLVLTAAIAIDGALLRRGALVEVSEAEAKNFLHRGKARLATDADMPPDVVATPPDDAAERAAEAQAAAEREAAEKAAAEAKAKAEAEAKAKAKASK